MILPDAIQAAKIQSVMKNILIKIARKEKWKFEKSCEGIWRFVIFMEVRFEKYYELFYDGLFSCDV